MFLNCCSKASPGDSHLRAKKTVRTPENIEAVCVAVTADQTKDLFDPSVVSANRNDLGLFLHCIQQSLKSSQEFREEFSQEFSEEALEKIVKNSLAELDSLVGKPETNLEDLAKLIQFFKVNGTSEMPKVTKPKGWNLRRKFVV